MRIQHNILAMNAYRNYNTNTSALAKNLEKLSSGYKINRAGDDAAGLAISEKMRAQITGLNAAQKNVKDGISLVKTAEGAMQEIQDMLNRMDYLATQSANGTYDDPVDRLNLQKEVDALKTEINRIADSANFNGIKLLDGSMDENVKAVTDTISTTTGGKSDVPILQDVATDPTAEVGDKTVLREPTAPVGKTTIQMELGDVALTGQEGDEFTVKVGDTEIKLTVTELGDNVDELKAGTSYTGKALADKIVSAFQAQGSTIQKQGFTATASVDANGNASVKFEQTNEPTTKDEVVGTNVAVEFTHKQAPDGHPTEYSLAITDTEIKKGDTITIGDIKVKLEDTNGVAQSLNEYFGSAGKDVGDYNVKYDATNNKLIIKDKDGTAGKPTVTFDSYSDPVKMESTQVKGEDAVKAAYTVKVKSSGVYSKGEQQVYSSQITTGNFTGAVKASYTYKITAGGTFADGETLTIAGQTLSVKDDGSGDITSTDAANSAKLAAAIAAKLNGNVDAADYSITSDNDNLVFTAKNAGKVGNTAADHGPNAAPTATPTTLAVTGSVAGTVTIGAQAAGTTGQEAETIQIGTGATSKTFTVGGDTTDLDAGKISVADANDATKLAKIIADNTTKAGYTVTSNGDKVVFTADVTGLANGHDGDAPPAATAADVDFTVTNQGGSAAVTAGAAQTVNAGKEPDTLTIAGVTLKIDTDISAADASDSTKLAAALAKKLNADPAYEDKYDITSDGDNLVFTAKVGGKVNGSTPAVPTADPAALPKTDAVSPSGKGNGKVEFGNVTNTAEGKDATKSYSEYDLSSLKAGDIITVGTGSSAPKYIVGEDGLSLTDTNEGGTTTFEDAVETAAGGNVAVTIEDGKLKIEADNAGSNEAAPKATIKVESKGTTDATSKLDTPNDKGSITGTWNVQSTVNKEGGAANAGPLASTAFTMDTNMVKDGNTLTIGKDTYVFKVGADSTVEAKDGQKLIDLSAFEADDANLVKNAAIQLSNVTDNSAFTIGYDEKATGDTTTAKITIHEKLGQTDYDKELQSVEEFDKLVYMTAPEVTTTEDVTTGFDGKPLTLQIGDTSDKFNQMQVSIGDMHTAAMGKGTATLDGEEIEVTKTIADIDISSLEGAQEAVAVIKNAINYVSSVRGDLGATQNRLEHTANNLSVMAENIQDAESTIRDTDIAEEMMAYTKNNILIQSAQAMLAQANAVPQGVLQLLG